MTEPEVIDAEFDVVREPDACAQLATPRPRPQYALWQRLIAGVVFRKLTNGRSPPGSEAYQGGVWLLETVILIGIVFALCLAAGALSWAWSLVAQP